MTASSAATDATGFVIAATGLQALGTGIGWEIYDRTHDALSLGLTGLARALPADSITAMKPGLPAVKRVSQPFPSWGGRQEEKRSAFNTRVAERLRQIARRRKRYGYRRALGIMRLQKSFTTKLHSLIQAQHGQIRKEVMFSDLVRI